MPKWRHLTCSLVSDLSLRNYTRKLWFPLDVISFLLSYVVISDNLGLLVESESSESYGNSRLLESHYWFLAKDKLSQAN